MADKDKSDVADETSMAASVSSSSSLECLGGLSSQDLSLRLEETEEACPKDDDGGGGQSNGAADDEEEDEDLFAEAKDSQEARSSGEKRSHETTEESEEEEAAKRHKVDDDEEAEVEVSTEGGGGDDKSREDEDDDDAESESLISRARHTSSHSNKEEKQEAADESVIIESPRMDRAASGAAATDDSIIVLDSSSEDLLAKRSSILLSSSTTGNSVQDTNNGNGNGLESETIFTKVKRKAEKEDEEGEQEAKDGVPETMAGSTEASSRTLEGQHSDIRRPDSAAAGLSSSSSPAVFAESSPNLSGVSPFEQNVMKKVRGQQTRKTSTPGTATATGSAAGASTSPRKRLAKESGFAKFDTSDDGNDLPESAKRPRIPPSPTANNKKKENKSSQDDDHDDNEPQDATLEFKTPLEAETLFVIRNPSEEQAAMLRKIAEENSMELEEMKRSMDDESFRQLYQSAHRSTSLCGSGKGGQRGGRAPARLSDATTLSANSRSSSSVTSSSTGYHADGSSGTATTTGTNSSEGSKRSRESMRIEDPIGPHHVHSPLPKYPLPKPRPDRPKRGGKKSSKTAGRGGNETDSLPDIPEAEQPKESPITKPQPHPATPVKEEEPVIHTDCVVFAKFKEGYSSVRFWPAVVQRMVTDAGGGEWEVEFVEDEVKVTVKTEDLIPAASLRAGYRVTHFGFSKGQSKNGVLASHADMSQLGKGGKGGGVISYRVEFGEEETELVPHTNIFLKADQAKAIKKDFGGQWATPTKTKAPPSASRHDISLDNLVDNKRRGARTSSVSTPSSAVATPKDGTKGKGGGRRKKGGDHVETEVETSPDRKKVTAAAATKNKRDSSTPAGNNASSARRRVLQDSTTDDDKSTKCKAAAAKTSKKRPKRGGKEGKAEPEQIFAGLNFILTKSNHVPPQEEVHPMENETEEDEEDQEEEEDDAAPLQFEKRRVAEVIRAGGGNVLASFPGSDQPIPKELFVISDRACKTMTYLLAMTYNFPAVSFQWVLHSAAMREQKNFRHYMLPVGYSMLTMLDVEYRERTSHQYRDRTSLFKDKTLVVTGEDASSIGDWHQLLTRLGATVYEAKPRGGGLDAKMKKVDAVVTATGEFPSSIASDARKKGVDVVGTTWVIESIVNGEVATLDSFRVETKA